MSRCFLSINFEDAALTKPCELDSDSDVIHLSCTAKIVHDRMFEEAKPFIGFTEGCNKLKNQYHHCY